MSSEAAGAFGDGWDSIKNYAPGELKKLSVQLVEITKNVARNQIDSNEGYPIESGKILLKMTINALEAVLVAVSALTLIAVQNAINAILSVLKGVFTEVADLIL